MIMGQWPVVKVTRQWTVKVRLQRQAMATGMPLWPVAFMMVVGLDHTPVV
jgi:hypothetical protein